MDNKSLVSKYLYRVDRYDEFPSLIKVTNHNEDYTEFECEYKDNGNVKNLVLSDDVLFKYFNIVRPKYTISLKEADNLDLFIAVNIYLSEDSDRHYDDGLQLNLIDLYTQNFIIPRVVNYIHLESNNSIQYEDCHTIRVAYGYYNSNIEYIISSLFDHKLKNKSIVSKISMEVEEYLKYKINLITVSREDLNHILFGHYTGLDFLMKISKKSIDVGSIILHKYDFTFDENYITQYYKDYTILILRYKDLAYIVLFKERSVLTRSESETGFNNDEFTKFITNSFS